MFEKVLVPTDFSKYSQSILECIGMLPGIKSVVLLHVIQRSPLARVWDPTTQVEDAKEKIEKQKSYLKALSLDVKTRVEVILEGDTSRVIQNVADDENASLIVMGARGKGRVGGLLLGSVSKNALLYGHTDLLIMRYKVLEGESLGAFCKDPFTKVLCPTDFSDSARSAVHFVKDLSGVKEIGIQHVVSTGETAEQIDASVQEAANLLNVLRKEIEHAGLVVKVHVSVGYPPEEISALADNEDVSLIAMSSHGMGWLQQMVVGSTTFETAKTANRPVLIIRAEKKA